MDTDTDTDIDMDTEVEKRQGPIPNTDINMYNLNRHCKYKNREQRYEDITRQHILPYYIFQRHNR